jgi:hypothetical protein
VSCGCGGNSTAAPGAPLLSGVLTAQYGDDPGLALSNPPSTGQVAADVAGSPGAVFSSPSRGLWIGAILFIALAAVVLHGAGRKSE